MRKDVQRGRQAETQKTLLACSTSRRLLSEKNDLDGAIASLNRVTVNDPRMAPAWTLLVSAYLRRAAVTRK